MKSNVELRNLAWKRLWADHWFGRLFGGGLLLGLCGYAVQVILSGSLWRLGVQNWFDYLGAVAQNRQDLTTPIPNLTHEYVSQACSSTVLVVFFSFLMAGLVAYGEAVILKKCLANDGKDWLGEAFGGFRFPFGVLWLWTRLRLIWLGWTAVAVSVPAILCAVGLSFFRGLPPVRQAIVAGVGVTICLCWAIFVLCIPFYRYRFLFLVKAEHPDWSARACCAACRELMRGNLLKSFRLDCSYWKPVALVCLSPLLILLAVTVGELVFGGWLGSAIAETVAVLCLGLFLLLVLIVSQYISVGQGLLYRELKAGGDAV